jgi:hypothetical protein
MSMKNITLAVDEEVLEAVRVYAAEHKTTVNALVRGYLAQLAQQRQRARDAMSRLRRLSLESRAELGPDYKFDREGLYER